MLPVDDFFLWGSILIITWGIVEGLYREKFPEGEEVPDDKGNAPESKVSKSLRDQIIIMIIYLIITDYRNNWQLDMNNIRWICFILANIGSFIRCWAKYTLGKYFTYSVGIRSDHKLITNGPYKYLIHPAYFGSLLHGIGFCIFFTPDFRSTYGAIWIGFILGLRFMYYRIKMEDKVLEKEFGKQFTDRLKTTNRVIPFIY